LLSPGRETVAVTREFLPRGIFVARLIAVHNNPRMTSAIRHVTIHCSDAYSLGSFWSDVLGLPIHEDDKPGDEEALIEGAGLLFITAPEGETVARNRIHLDIQPQDRTREEEVERLIALGATLVHDRRRPDGTGWAVLADPDGNEFCVERSQAERTGAASA
jgi:catechol 2,3-dioxygenase-like lactoylglutathione lyase family enzyme